MRCARFIEWAKGPIGALLIILFVYAVVELSAARAATAQETRIIRGERFAPAVWVDPDGCEHWVMDDGWEGFMTPNRRRDGTPVCRRSNTCVTEPTDRLFASGSATLSQGHRARLHETFRQLTVTSVVVDGHTDSRGSYEAMMRLSERRAMAVAEVARQAGVRISQVRGWGPTRPVADNASAAGRAQNRRIEVLCIR